MRLGLELNSQLTEWPSQHFKAVYSQFVLKKFCPDLPQLDERKIWLCKILCPLLSCYPKHLSEINADRPFFFFLWMPVTHQRLVFNLLSDEFVLTEGIACLSSDGVYGSLLHLLFDGTEQHEERLARTLLLFWKGTQGLEWKVGEKRKWDIGKKWGEEKRSVFISTALARAWHIIRNKMELSLPLNCKDGDMFDPTGNHYSSTISIQLT